MEIAKTWQIVKKITFNQNVMTLIGFQATEFLGRAQVKQQGRSRLCDATTLPKPCSDTKLMWEKPCEQGDSANNRIISLISLFIPKNLRN